MHGRLRPLVGACAAAVTLSMLAIGAPNAAQAADSPADSPEIELAAAPAASATVLAQAGNTMVYLDWSPVIGSNQYRVDVLDASGKLIKTMPSATTSYTTPKATITGLANGTEYTFIVKADIGDATETLPAVNATPAAVAPMPTRAPVLNSSTYDSLTVTVTAVTALAPASPVTGYRVRFTPDSANAETVIVDTDADELKVSAHGLVTNEMYTVDYAALNELGGSEGVSAWSSLKLRTAPTGAPAPGNFHVVRNGNRTVYLDWSAVDDATKYNVYYKPSAGGTEKTLAVTASSAAVTGLDNGTEYDFQVAAVVSLGAGSKIGDRSSVVRATPVSSTVPTGVHIVTEGNTKVWLDWREVKGAEAYYIKAVPVNASLESVQTAMNKVAKLYQGESTKTGIAIDTNAAGEDVNYIYAWNGRGLHTPPEAGEAAAAAAHATFAKTVNAVPEFSDVYIFKSNGSWPTNHTSLLPKGNVALIAEVANGGVCWADMGKAGSVAVGAEPGVAHCEGVWTPPLPPVPAPVKIAANATASNKAIGNLVNGAEYQFFVASVLDGAIGDYSPDSDSPTGTPTSVPNAVTVSKGTVTSTSIQVKWTAATVGTGVQAANRYKVILRPIATGETVVAEVGNELSYAATGLTPGESYLITVQAGNDKGYGPLPATTLNVAAVDKPAAPINANATREADGTGVHVTWQAGAASAATAVKSYTVTPKATTAGAAVPKAVVVYDLDAEFTDLDSNAGYTFTIQATNDAGASSGTIATLPAP